MNKNTPLIVLMTLVLGCPTPSPNIDPVDAGRPESGGSRADAGTFTDGGTSFNVDTSNPEVFAPVQGDSGDFQIIARLASPGGRRTIILAGGGTEQEIAPAGWNLPPVGVRSITPGPDSGAMLVCWDTLIGQEPSPDKMPQPSQGMKLLCRYRALSGGMGNAFVVGFDAPTWLKSVGVDSQGRFTVMMLRDGAGTLFGKVTPGDGLYSVSVSKGIAASAELVKAR